MVLGLVNSLLTSTLFAAMVFYVHLKNVTSCKLIFVRTSFSFLFVVDNFRKKLPVVF